ALRKHPLAQAALPPETHRVRDIYLPVGLVATGLLAWFGLGLFAPLYPERGMAISAAVIAAAFIVNLVLLLSGVYLSSLALGINFGSLSSATLKLAGIGTFTGAI